MKRAVSVNISYFKEHFEEIKNNTGVLLPEWLFKGLSANRSWEFQYMIDQLTKKHLHESGNWYIFGRGDRWIGPGETWEEAEDRIVREYCEATGHWDLFIWEEV